MIETILIRVLIFIFILLAILSAIVIWGIRKRTENYDLVYKKLVEELKGVIDHSRFEIERYPNTYYQIRNNCVILEEMIKKHYSDGHKKSPQITQLEETLDWINNSMVDH